MSDGAPARLELTTESIRDVVVVRVEGEVDLGNSEQFAAALRAVAGSDSLVIDLVGVPFMDSSGLKVLLVASQEFGDALALALEPDSPIAHLLQIAEVGDRFSIHPTAAEAVEAQTRP